MIPNQNKRKKAKPKRKTFFSNFLSTKTTTTTDTQQLTECDCKLFLLYATIWMRISLSFWLVPSNIDCMQKICGFVWLVQQMPSTLYWNVTFTVALNVLQCMDDATAASQSMCAWDCRSVWVWKCQNRITVCSYGFSTMKSSMCRIVFAMEFEFAYRKTKLFAFGSCEWKY